MTAWKDNIPNELKSIYHQARGKIWNPESDWFFKRIYGDRITITHKNIQATYDTSTLISKRWFYPRYRDGSLHEPVVSRKIFDLLEEDSTFFDIGSNVGFYTVMSSYYCDEVHSFEMDPRLVNIINSHLRHNPHRKATVRVTLGAVSENSGEFISFSPHINDNLSTNQVSNNQTQPQASLRIPTVSIDDYSEKLELSPDTLKIDVEGYEVQVLDGIDSISSNVHTLFLEVHPSLLENYGHEVREVFVKLDQLGFDYQRFTDHRANVSPDKSLENLKYPGELTENSMLLCTR